MARSAKKKRPRRLLIVCHGNKWRSPLAAAALAASGGGALEVKSAGFRKTGERAARRVRLLAEVLGYDLEAHRSAILSADMLVWADAVIYMDGGNRRRLEEAMLATRCQRPYACLGAWCNPPRTRIPDPAFISDRRVFVQLLLAVEGAARALARSLAGPGDRLPGQFSSGGLEGPS